jgi:hypothetical protein
LNDLLTGLVDAICAALPQDMTDEQHGWLRLQLGELDQRIVAAAY